MNNRPPRWIPVAFIGTGIVLLLCLPDRKASMIALLCVFAFAGLVGALMTLASVIAAGRADQAAGWTEEEIRRRADDLANQLRADITTDPAEITAAAVIQDEPISTSGRSHNLNRGGETGSQRSSSSSAGRSN